MLAHSKLSPAEPSVVSLGGKTEGGLAEIPGSAEYVAARLTGRELACPHLPKYRVGDARHQQRYPSRLGFFHASSIETRISFLDTSKLCPQCLAAVVPDGFTYWSTSVPLSNTSPNRVASSSDSSYPLLFQAGTEEFHHNQLRPDSTSVPSSLRTAPLTIGLPCVDGAKEAWQWLQAERKPFYIDQLHLTKGWSPLAEIAAEMDSIICRAVGTPFQTTSLGTEKKKDSEKVSAKKTSKRNASESKVEGKTDNKAAQISPPIADVAAIGTTPDERRTKGIKVASEMGTEVAKNALRPAGSRGGTYTKNWHRQAPIPLDSPITVTTYSDYLRSAGPLGPSTADLPLERLLRRSHLISDTKDLLDSKESSGPPDLLRLLEPRGKRISPARIASSGLAKLLVDQAPAKRSPRTEGAGIGSTKIGKECRTRLSLSEENERPKTTKKSEQHAPYQHPSQPAAPRRFSADKKPQNKPTQKSQSSTPHSYLSGTLPPRKDRDSRSLVAKESDIRTEPKPHPTQAQGQSRGPKLKNISLPPPKGPLGIKQSGTNTFKPGKNEANPYTGPSRGLLPKPKDEKGDKGDRCKTKATQADKTRGLPPKPKDEKGDKEDKSKTEPTQAKETLGSEGKTSPISQTDTSHTETQPVSTDALPATGLGSAGFVTSTEALVTTTQVMPLEVSGIDPMTPTEPSSAVSMEALEWTLPSTDPDQQESPPASNTSSVTDSPGNSRAPSPTASGPASPTVGSASPASGSDDEGDNGEFPGGDGYDEPGPEEGSQGDLASKSSSDDEEPNVWNADAENENEWASGSDGFQDHSDSEHSDDEEPKVGNANAENEWASGSDGFQDHSDSEHGDVTRSIISEDMDTRNRSESESGMEDELEGEATEGSSHYVDDDGDDGADEEASEYNDNISGSDDEDADVDVESHADGDMSSPSLSDADVSGQDEDEDDEVDEDDAEIEQDDDEETQESEAAEGSDSDHHQYDASDQDEDKDEDDAENEQDDDEETQESEAADSDSDHHQYDASDQGNDHSDSDNHH